LCICNVVSSLAVLYIHIFPYLIVSDFASSFSIIWALIFCVHHFTLFLLVLPVFTSSYLMSLCTYTSCFTEMVSLILILLLIFCCLTFKVYENTEVKKRVASTNPYGKWLAESMRTFKPVNFLSSLNMDNEVILRHQQ